MDVRSIDVTRSIIQQVFSYGDILIRTYTGGIEMADVGEPDLIKNFIDEYWKRALEHSREDAKDEIDNRLREKLGLPVKQRRRFQALLDDAAKKRKSRRAQRIRFFQIFSRISLKSVMKMATSSPIVNTGSCC